MAVAAWLALVISVVLTNRIRPGMLRTMSYPSVYAWQDELSTAEFQAALDVAKHDAERVRAEFVASLPAVLYPT